MSANELAVLKRLQAAKQAGEEFIPLPDVHQRTLNALFRKDWLFTRERFDGVMHKLTERGERAIKVYDAPPIRRTDGICPDCGEQPVHVFKTGRKAGYCKGCLSKLAAREYAHNLYLPKAGKLCSRCGKRPILVRASGKSITYCAHCNRVIKRREKKRLRRRKARLMQAGTVLICTKPGCTNPRYCMPNTISDWCYDHYRAYQTEYNKRKKAERMVAKINELFSRESR